MAFDPHEMDDDDPGSKDGAGPQRKYTEFDCPECNANNPVDDPIADGAELRCNYCGEEFRAHLTDEGRLKLRLL
ncbi:transcription elongation factor 1 family protein [Anaeromyxobacter paludicola]|uniref:Uncharacterized protein n=1 Tax=Anaeromyxobacter paludicola TaxID=2918171 RepID=A0ABM7X5M5_9BACT|nr:transcription elongation factor 1 family protein [Anaeromyxobacter paludicola]BDG07118.1 hypothetical protein AMPC_02310 [Anaeromyxobacter paludicola]